MPQETTDAMITYEIIATVIAILALRRKSYDNEMRCKYARQRLAI